MVTSTLRNTGGAGAGGDSGAGVGAGQWHEAHQAPSEGPTPTVQGSAGRVGRRQYVRAEYCAGGDLEGLVRRAGHLDVLDVRAFLFQMCFALYACREQLALRHLDVKLLNFLVTHGAAALPPSQRAAALAADAAVGGHGNVHLKVGFGEYVFTVPLRAAGLGLVKLADFGASAVGAAALGEPIGAPHFTTLENAPPEFLVLGSGARQVRRLARLEEASTAHIQACQPPPSGHAGAPL